MNVTLEIFPNSIVIDSIKSRRRSREEAGRSDDCVARSAETEYKGMTRQALERRDSHSRITVTRVITHRRKRRCGGWRRRAEVDAGTKGAGGVGRVAVAAPLARRLPRCAIRSQREKPELIKAHNYLRFEPFVLTGVSCPI